MLGTTTIVVLGFDHAGISTLFKTSGKTRHNLSHKKSLPRDRDGLEEQVSRSLLSAVRR